MNLEMSYEKIIPRQKGSGISESLHSRQVMCQQAVCGLYDWKAEAAAFSRRNFRRQKIGNAVARNWVKRRIRQSLTELKPQLKQDCDFIVIARPGVAFMSTAEVKQHLIHVLHLAKVLNDDQFDSDLR